MAHAGNPYQLESDSHDPNRFEIYRPYLTAIAFQLIGRKLRSKIAPEDLVQQTLLAALLAEKSYRGITAAQRATWLYAILRNEFRKEYRNYVSSKKRSCTREISSSAIDLNLVGSSSDETESETTRQEALISAINRLKPEERWILQQRYFDGAPINTIAKALLISRHAVHRRLEGIIAKMRILMQELRESR